MEKQKAHVRLAPSTVHGMIASMIDGIQNTIPVNPYKVGTLENRNWYYGYAINLGFASADL